MKCKAFASTQCFQILGAGRLCMDTPDHLTSKQTVARSNRADITNSKNKVGVMGPQSFEFAVQDEGLLPST